MLNEVKDALNEYHNYRLNKSVMEIIVPLIIVGGIILGAIFFIPLNNSRNEAVKDKKYLQGELAKISTMYRDLKDYNQQLLAENSDLKTSIVNQEIANQQLRSLNDGLEQDIGKLTTLVTKDNRREGSLEESI